MLKPKQKYAFYVLVMLFSTSIVSVSQAETLKVCYDQWSPMTMFTSEENTERGVVIDMLAHIYTSQGYELEYFEVPLARGLKMVSDGLCDILPEYLYSRSSEHGFEFASEPTFIYTSAFVVRQGDPWRYQGEASLKNKRIATGPGWDYSSMSIAYQQFIDDKRNRDSIEVIAGDDDVVDRILLMIKEGRVDLYADNELVLQYSLNRLNLNDELQIVRPGLDQPMIELPIFSNNMSSEKRQKLMQIWNEGRNAIKGEQEKVFLDKYEVTLGQ